MNLLSVGVFHQTVKAALRRQIFACLLPFVCLGSLATLAHAVEVPDVGKPGGAMPGAEFSPAQPSQPVKLPETVPPKTAAPASAQTRITVRKIVLKGVVDRPDYDISLEELRAFVEKLRQDKLLRQSSKEQPTAQSTEQSTLERWNKLLKEMEKVAGETQGKTELEVLEEAKVRMSQKESPEETLSLLQLQEIAASVAQYYRERGFFLVQAFIPPQTITDDVVQLFVLESTLGNVTVEQNKHYTSAQLLLPFHELLGKPVNKGEIEAALLHLNDYPGLKTFAVFKPGTHTGETDLVVSVVDEKYVAADFHVDNYGSVYTGEYRGRITLTANNPLKAMDRASISLSKTYEPAKGVFGAFSYERSAFGHRNTFGISLSQNTYSLGDVLEPFNIDGKSTITKLSWRRAFHRGRLFNSYGLLQFARKSAKLGITEGEDREDELTVLSAETGFNWLTSDQSHIGMGWLELSHGFDGLLGAMETTSDPALTTTTRRGGSGQYAGGEFNKAKVDYQHWWRLSRNHSLHLSMRAQFSNDLLTSLEQMPIGGPNSVRAYAASEYLRDRAYSYSLEWLMRAPGFSGWKAFGGKYWGEIFQLALFADYAQGWLNDPNPSDVEEVSLSGVGAGVRFNHKSFSARFEIATPTGDEKASNERNPQYFFEINYGL